MSNNIGNRPTIKDRVAQTVETVGNNRLVQWAGDTATAIAERGDQFDSIAAGNALLRSNGARRLFSSAVGASLGGGSRLVERLAPAQFNRVTGALTQGAQRLGLSPNVFRNFGSTAGRVVMGAGIGAIGYDAIRSFTDTKADMGSRIAQGLAAVGVGALTFTGIGTAVVVADVLTGGGVTGGVKGLVALADAALTGDRDALNGWVEGAKNGDSGWLIKKLANNKTVANVVGRGAEAVINAGARVSNWVSSGWRALTG